MERQIHQIALSVSDPARSLAWYRAVGLDASGGLGPAGGGDLAAVIRVPELEFNSLWLVGRNPMTQLELFEFIKPAPRPLSPSRTALDEGYGAVSIAVVSFEEQLERLNAEAGGALAITGETGSRSLWVKDPDGIPVELMERDVLASEPAHAAGAKLAGLRAVSLTVSDLERAKQYWTSVLGFTLVPPSQYRANPLPSWWAGGVEWQEYVVKGGSVLVRLLSPVAADIVARPRDYRLSDIGVLNIATISQSAQEHDAFVDVLRASGFEFSTPATVSSGPDSGVLYGYDPQGTSIETGYVRPDIVERWGWRL